MKNIMKKAALFWAAVLVLTGSIGLGVFADENDSIKVVADGAEIEFDVEPDNINGVVYVAIRPVLEAFTRDEVYYKTGRNGRVLTAYTADGTFSLDVDRGNYLYADDTGDYNKVGVLEYLPYIKEGRTMLPVREIVELLGGTVTYDEAERTISINSELYDAYSYLEGAPYPIVLREVDYDEGLASALTSSEGYEYLNELAEKVLQYEDNYYDGSYEDTPSEYYSYLKELCYTQVKYFNELGQFGDCDDYLSTYMKSYVSGDYSDVLIIDSALDNETSLRNLFDFLYKGENTSARVNPKLLPYARYMVLRVFGSSLFGNDEKDITAVTAKDFEGYSYAFSFWPFYSVMYSSSSGDPGYIEGYLERLYRNDADIPVILENLKLEYEPEPDEDDGSYEESRKEFFKQYFGDDWYYYYYGDNVYHTSFIG